MILAKSRTSMNRSGNAARGLLERYQLQPEEMLVICDDLELPVGRIRLRPRGSHGGHNGLRDIIFTLQSETSLPADQHRPAAHGRRRAADRPRHRGSLRLRSHGGEREALEGAVERAAEPVACLQARPGAAMNRYNR
jgi:PTH1 family peptidyl-tRNA hydrolase